MENKGLCNEKFEKRKKTLKKISGYALEVVIDAVLILIGIKIFINFGE